MPSVGHLSNTRCGHFTFRLWPVGKPRRARFRFETVGRLALCTLLKLPNQCTHNARNYLILQIEASYRNSVSLRARAREGLPPHV